MKSMATNIINTFDQLMAARAAGLPDIAVIARHIHSSSRNGSSFQSGWKVWRPGFAVSGSTEKNVWDPDYNCRVFSDWENTKADALKKALAWASKRYGVKVWKRNRMMRKVPLPNGSVQIRTIVFAYSMKHAAELLSKIPMARCSYSYLRGYWSETWNKHEVALSSVPSVWINKGNEYGDPMFERISEDR